MTGSPGRALFRGPGAPRALRLPVLLLLLACAGPESPAGGGPGSGPGGPAAVDYPGLDRPAPPPAAPRAPPAAELLDNQGRLGLRLLRAGAARAALEAQSRLVVPEGPLTFGVEVPLEVRLAHPLLEDVELLAPAAGPLLLLRVEIQRWLPLGNRERLEANPVVRLRGPVLVPADGSWSSQARQPLGAAGDPASLWQVTLAATVRCDGIRVGEEVLPVQEIALPPVRILALPPGWEDVAPKALDVLGRAASLEDPAADRHLLVAAALLAPGERPEGVRVLMASLDAGPGERRTRTILAALRWLTGQDLGDSPVAWQAWWRRRGGPHAGGQP